MQLFGTLERPQAPPTMCGFALRLKFRIERRFSGFLRNCGQSYSGNATPFKFETGAAKCARSHNFEQAITFS
jgi:hypothetical protein